VATPPTDEPRVSRIQSTHSEPPIDLPAEFGGQQPIALSSPVLGLLPDTVMAAVVATSPMRFIAATDAVEILKEYKESFAEANLPLTASQDTRLLQPSTWHNLGIDTDGSVGAAVMLENRLVALLFATLSDSEKFLKAIPEIAATVGLGDASIASMGERFIVRFSQKPGFALVVQRQALLLVTCERSSDLEPALKRILGSAQAPSLAQSARVAKAFSGLDYGDDVAGFVALDTIAAALKKDRLKNSGDDYLSSEVERLEAKVETAKASGVPQVDIDEIETSLSEVLRQYNRFSLRQSAEARFSDDVMGTLGTIGFGIDLDGRKAGLRVKIQATPGSLATRLLAPGGGPLELPRRLQEAPLWMLAAHTNKAAMLELFTLILNMDGESALSLAADVKEEFGIPLEKLLGAIEGEVSAALTVNLERLTPDGAAGSPADAFGLHILVELRDPAAVQQLLDQVATASTWRKYKVQEGEVTALEIPSFNKRLLRVHVKDRYLEVVSKGPPSNPPVWSDRESSLTQSASNLALLVLDPMALQWLVLEQGGEMTAEYAYLEGPQATASNEPNPKRAARLKDLGTQLAALGRERQVLRTTSMRKSSAALGRAVVVARPDAARSLAIFGSLVGTARNLGRGLQAVVETIEPDLESLRTGEKSERIRLNKKIYELRNEQWKLRMSGR